MPKITSLLESPEERGNAIARIINNRIKLNQEYSHVPQAKVYNPIGDILQAAPGRLSRGEAILTGKPIAEGIREQYLTDSPESIASLAMDWTNPVAGMAGIFAGKGAKTADLAKLAHAEELAKQGVPDAEIWKQTGWTLNTPDKMPRFEIPDNLAQASDETLQAMAKTPSEQYRVENLVSHDPLYGAYPDTKDISLYSYKGDGGSFAKGIADIPDAIKIGSDSGAKTTSLHELQHAIQQREGFARGGSPEMFKVSPEAMQGLHSYDDMAGAERILQQANQHGLTVDDYMKKPPRWVTEKQLAIAKTFENRPVGDFKYAKDYVLGAQDPYNAYQNLAGEAEARLTQARMNMTPEERLLNYPYEPKYFQEATGVPLSDLIVRKQ